jgi:CRP-like cAMP-binding protein
MLRALVPFQGRCAPGYEMTPGPYSPLQNHILGALRDVERERIFPDLQLVPMPLGRVLYESGDPLLHVYFPVDSIVSLLYVMENGASAEISVVGNEGLIGIALFMGGETTPSRAIVQSAGYAYRLPARRLKSEFSRHGELQLLLLRYTQRSSRRCPRQRCATDIIRLISSCAGGSSCRSIACPPTN